jgi:predicted metal-dependent hydrolase
MQIRRGSLARSGLITLNSNLIRAPKGGCIEYVIVHELCHLEHRNHGSKFYQLLTAEIRLAEAKTEIGRDSALSERKLQIDYIDIILYDIFMYSIDIYDI